MTEVDDGVAAELPLHTLSDGQFFYAVQSLMTVHSQTSVPKGFDKMAMGFLT